MFYRLDDEPDETPDVPEPIGPEKKEPGDNTHAELADQRAGEPAAQAAQGADLRRDQRQAGPRRDGPAAGAGERRRTPIDVFVNSPGGHVESGDTIHDMIRFVGGE